jgi:hypothetical protein
MNERLSDYSEGAQYMLKVVGDKNQALTLLGFAEKMKKIVADYESTGRSEGSLPPTLSPEILFGASESEIQAKFEELITSYKDDFEDLKQKAKTIMEGLGKVKKPEQVT